MYSRIKILRKRGQRLHQHDIQSLSAIEGDLTLSYCAGAPELKLSAWGDSTGKPVIPILYDAKLVTMHGSKMLFKGEERPQGNAGPAFIQEWAVQLED